ncbi:MAG TPA: GNAT family N-acetyltransferase [Bacteroidetes bacterium]|nr:GNAT family N-acetyltransferase [Bacteroidota bacterium]
MVQIRVATEEDRDFIASFQKKMAWETEGLPLDEETVNEGVLHVLRNPEKGKYFVADDDGRVVASLLITYEWSDWRNQQVLWIQSVYVLPEFRKKGVFKTLYNHIKDWALGDKNVAGIRLYVDKTNQKAMEVYRRLGMNGEHYRLFEWLKE